jgi:hypothetical protein
MEQSLSGFFPDSPTEINFLMKMCNQEADTEFWKTKFEEEQLAKQNLAEELAEEQSANKSLVDELSEEQNVLQELADELEKEKALTQNILYELSKEKSVSHRLRLERIIYMVCFSFGAISILMHDWCSKLI